MPNNLRTVFCDDIRREDSGKLILVGVYMDDLVPSSVPSTFPLSLWLTFKSEEYDTGKLSIILNLPGGNQIKLDGTMDELPTDSNVHFIFGGVPIEIKESGHISVQLKFGEEEPVEAGSLIVKSPRQASEAAPHN